MNETTAPPAFTRNEAAALVLLLTTIILMAANPVSGPWMIEQVSIVWAFLSDLVISVASALGSVVNALIMAVTSLF